MKLFYSIDPKAFKEAYRQTYDYFVANGNTTICDLSVMPLELDCDGIREDIYREMFEEGSLKARVELFPAITKSMKRVKDLSGLNLDDMVRFAGVKQFFDGVSSTHTAYLTDPYANAYFEGDCGRPSLELELMEQLIFLAQEKGYSMRIHTIGDRAVHCALDSFEKANAKFGRKPELQHTLEHVENILEDDVMRLHDLDILVSAQPGHALYDPAGIEADLGPERIKLMWPFRTFLNRGVKLAFGTDSPIVPANPLLTIYNAVTRENEYGEPEGGWMPEQKISLPEALIAHTLGSARACTMEAKIGSLTVGKYADIVVLDRNIFEIPAEELKDTQCILTVVNGKTVYEK